MSRFVRFYCVAIRKTSKAFGAFGAICLILIALLTTMDVILRKTINTPIYGSYEVVEVIIVFASVSCIAYTEAKKGHMFIDVIFEHLPVKFKTGLRIFGLAIGFVFSAIIVWRNIVRTVNIFQGGRETSLLHIVLWPIVGFIALGFLLYFLELIITTLITVKYKGIEDLK